MQPTPTPPLFLLQTPSPHQNTHILPSSDFADLILVISHHELSFHAFLTSPPASPQLEKQLSILQQQSRDLSAHYGWVLASDVVMVGRMFGGDEERAREWVRSLVRRVDEIGKGLGEVCE
jgi:hypothetical protein